MKKRMLALGFAALAVALALPGSASAASVGVQVTLAPLGRAYGAPPPLGRKQGWLTISNRDWQSYSLAVGGDDKLFLYRSGHGYGGINIPSGATVTIALEKDNYDLYGDNSDRLKVRIREGRTTTLSLEPFGYTGQAGLMGVVNDGDKVRNEVLYQEYRPPVVVQRPPVVVQRPPTVIVERPAPPPVIINRPPIVVGRPSHRPPPPRPGYGPGYGHGGRRDKDKDWGFSFSFGGRR